jgi:hypothetical protein
VAERFVIDIPHRGRLHGVTIRVMEIREHVFERYRQVTEPLLPERRLGNIWTPRELLLYVRKQSTAPALTALTDLVEHVYFGHSPKVADPIAEAEARIRALQLELSLELPGSLAIRAAPP